MGNSRESEDSSAGSAEKRKLNQRWPKGLWVWMVVGVATDETLRVTDFSTPTTREPSMSHCIGPSEMQSWPCSSPVESGPASVWLSQF